MNKSQEIAQEQDVNVRCYCDKCGQVVSLDNDATFLEAIISGKSVMILLTKARHLLSTGECEGSPSRAQYIEGQPKDPRYKYDEEYGKKVRKAYVKMQHR